MNEPQLDPRDRTSTPALRRTISPAFWWTLAAIWGFLGALYANTFFATGAEEYGFKAVFNGLVVAGIVWYLLRPPTPAQLLKVSPVLKWTSLAIFGFLAALAAYGFFTTGEQLKANLAVSAVMFGLMAVVLIWDLLRTSRANKKK